MKLETHQHFGHHGILYIVSHFTVMPGDRSRLRQLHFHEVRAGKAQFELNDLIVDVYEKMYAKNMSCAMKVGISRPLTREQADILNQQRDRVSDIAAAAVGGVTKPLGWTAGLLAGGTKKIVLDRLRTYHSGDVVVFVDAVVKGGIGPQHSSASLIIQSKVLGRR